MNGRKKSLSLQTKVMAWLPREERGLLSEQLLGLESAFSERKCPWNRGMALGVSSLWTRLQAERDPGAGSAQGACIVTAGAAVQAGSGGLLELAPAGTSSMLSFAFWAAWVKMVTQRICVMSPACGLAVWISQEPLKDRKIKERVMGEEMVRDARRESTETVETEEEAGERLRRWERWTKRWGNSG